MLYMYESHVLTAKIYKCQSPEEHILTAAGLPLKSPLDNNLWTKTILSVIVAMELLLNTEYTSRKIKQYTV